MTTSKTTFTRDELAAAVEQVFRLKVRGWQGTLRLETDNYQRFFISQFPDNNSWSEGCDTVMLLDDSFEPWFESGVPMKEQTVKKWDSLSWDYVTDAQDEVVALVENSKEMSA